MEGIKIGVIVKKKHSDSHQEPAIGETQTDNKRGKVYVKNPESHKKFVKNIFSILTT